MSTSSTPGEGKTFFTVSLATILAQSGSKVLLIDGDMKRNSLTEFMLGNSHPQATLMDYIQGNKTLEQIIMPLHIPTLMIIPSSMNTAYSQEYLNSDRMHEMIEKLRKQFDYIIFDSPPVLAVSDALITGKVCDASLFIVRWGVTPKKMVKNAIRLIRYADIPFNGCILTQVNLDKQKHYDHGDTAHYYGVYDAYDKKAQKV